MVTEIFSVIGDSVTALANAIVSAGSSIVGLFWTAPATGETGAGSPTFLGVLLLIALAGGLVFFVIRLIRGAMGRVA